jgi:PKD repeat protein
VRTSHNRPIANRVALSLLALAALASPAPAQQAIPTATPMTMPSIPQIQLQPLPGYGPAPLTVGFMVSSFDPETVPQSFVWNFGDGQVSTLPPTALFHTFIKPGSYVVTVTATTADGHQATSFAAVTVTSPGQ